MSRIFFLLAIVVTVYLLLKSYRKPAAKLDEPKGAEDMVRCAQCGVHMPKSESILAGGNFYCSNEHRTQHQSK